MAGTVTIGVNVGPMSSGAARLKLIRWTGMGLVTVFAAVGICFLVIPGQVLSAFNRLGDLLGWPASPTDAYTLFLALAAGYMWVVTVLAWRMAREPENGIYPWLLMQAKAASALICLLLFAVQDRYAIYLVNFLVDGAIAVFVWAVALRRGRRLQRRPVRARGSRSTATEAARE